MRIRKTTLIRRIKGLARMLFPACTFRTIGMPVRMNSTGRSHIIINKGMGKPSLKFRLLTTSRIINGSTSKKLNIAGNLRFVSMVCIISPGAIRNRCAKVASNMDMCLPRPPSARTTTPAVFRQHNKTAGWLPTGNTYWSLSLFFL